MALKLISVLAVLALFPAISALAQENDYQKWLQKEKQQYQNYLDAEDQAFSSFLKKDWQQFQSFQGVKFDTKPKPVKMPVADEKEKPRIEPVAPLKKVKPLPPPPPPTPKPQTKPLPEPQPVPTPEDKTTITPREQPLVSEKKDQLKFDFFQASLTVTYKKLNKGLVAPPVSNEKISKAWESMAASDYKPLVKQLLAYRKSMSLNDWGFLLLVHKLARQMFPASDNDQNVFTWFIMTKSGFETKIAYRNDTIFLLLPAGQMIYENPFVTIDGKKFYFISLNRPVKLEGKIYTYKGNYKNADRPLDMRLTSLPSIRNQVATKKLTFRYGNSDFVVEAQYDQDVVSFFKDYPQTDLVVYFDAPVSRFARYSLLKSLRPMLKDKTEVEAVNFLLRFVQTSFDYKTDDQQFGREKYLMAEETIFYPSSDCEDRSVLFAYLVRNLLGMEVIGLDYPGHISTAVKFSDNLPGDAVTYNGSRYIICDPTYINAVAGMAMPQFKNVDPEVIRL